MFINVDYNRRLTGLKLHLATPKYRVKSAISEKFNETLSTKFSGISELNFSIPHQIDSEEGLIPNKHIEQIKEKMLIRATVGAEKEWFVVDEIIEDSDNSDVFNVKAYSLGYELQRKLIKSMSVVTENAENLALSILEGTAWKIGVIDQKFKALFRTFEVTDSNALDCIIQLADTFGAVIIWHTSSRKIDLVDLSTYGRFRGLTVNYGRLLRSITKSRTSDEMVTRLYIEGNEGLTIHSVNPTGQPFLEDFSYFMYPFERDANKNVIKSSDFMSDALCNALIEKQSLTESNTPIIQSITSELAIKNTELVTETTILTQMQLDMENILDRLDVAKATEDEVLVASIIVERDNKQADINTQTSKVQRIQGEINALNLQLDTIREDIDSQANFTPDLMEELKLFIIEKEWKDDRYIDETELYNDGIKKFQELREPKVVIEVDIDNLFNIMEEQYYWDKLSLGDLIKIKYPQMNIEYKARIIEINYDFGNREINLVIANASNVNDEMEQFRAILKDASKTSSLVGNSKYKWDKINSIEKNVNDIMTQEWDANRNKIIAGVNNTVEVGNRGIIIRNPDFPKEVVIMQAGIIALSKDGGDTWKTAIKPDGIVAERLIGQIIAGQELLITNSSGSFTMDANGAIFDVDSFTIRSGDGKNVVDRWQGTSDFVDEYKDDNLITAYEKKMLNIKWQEIKDRYDANTEKINTYYGTEELVFVTNYQARYQQLYDYLFVTLHGGKALLAPDNLAYTTRVLASEFDAVFRNYDSARVELEKQIEIRAKESVDEAQRRIDEVENDVVYKTELHSSNGLIFNNGEIYTIVTAKVYRGKDDITDTLPASAFIWKKTDRYGVSDTAWNSAHIGVGKQITIDQVDVDKKATFWCEINIPE